MNTTSAAYWIGIIAVSLTFVFLVRKLLTKSKDTKEEQIEILTKAFEKALENDRLKQRGTNNLTNIKSINIPKSKEKNEKTNKDR